MLRLPPNIRPPAFLGINHASPQAKSLVGWYLPIRTTSSAALDESGRGYHMDDGPLLSGETPGAVVSAGAPSGRAWDCNATNKDNLVQFGTCGLSGPPYTLTIWANVTDGAGDAQIFGFADSGSAFRYARILFNDTSNQVWWQTNDTVADNWNAFGAAYGQWYHYAVVVKATNNVDVYLDGELLTAGHSTSKAWNNYNRTSINVLARSSPTNVGTMQADDARVYNRALNASQIRDIYQNPYDLWYWPEHNIVPEQAAAPVTAANNLTLLGVG